MGSWTAFKMNLAIDLNNVLQKSAESTILDMSVTTSGFVFHCILPDLSEDQLVAEIDDPILEMHVKAEYTFLQNNRGGPKFPCFFRLLKLNDYLDVNEWGYYVPSANKKSFFSQVKNKSTLAYGKHASKYTMLFFIEPGFFQALIHDLSDITCTIISKKSEETR